MCETHDPTGEPDAGEPPVRFGERRLETEPWRGVRHRHCESCREQLPPSAYRYRVSRRLYNHAKHIGGYFTPEVSRQLRIIAAGEDMSIQNLLAESLDMLFHSRQMPTIA